MQQSAVKTIRWGIIGLGRIAHSFASDLQKVPYSSLHGVASRSLAKAEQFATSYGVSHYYDSYESLLQNDEIDAIYIATPHVFHKEHTLLSLDFGKAVLCEKPFAMNADEVALMIQKAREKNVLLMEALWTAFLPHYQYVLKCINDNSLGELKHLNANFCFAPELNFEDRVLDKNLGGGALLDIGIYPIFAALSSLGIPKDIKAKATFFDNGADSSCTIRFDYSNAIADLHCSLMETIPSEATFTFEKGELFLHSEFYQTSQITKRRNGVSEHLDFGYQSLGYTYEIEHFNALLRSGKTESPIMSFAFSKQLIGLMDEVRRQIGLKYSK